MIPPLRSAVNADQGRLRVEPDAPSLAPDPHRSKRNEPAWVSHTVAKLAEARGLSAERLGSVITAITARYFSLPVSL